MTDAAPGVGPGVGPAAGTDLVVEAPDRAATGRVRPGESWAAAADRVAAPLGVAAVPTPVDLSGAPLRFTADPTTAVAVRPMTRADVDLVLDWRADPEVMRWWEPGEVGRDRSGAAAAYVDRIEGRSPTRMWILEVNGRSAGFVQDYRLGDYPDHPVVGAGPDTVGVDYAIGAGQWRGRGLGPRVLWAWMVTMRRTRPDATTYFAAPDHRNAASRRILRKAGFTEGVWFDEPQSDGSSHTVVGHTLDVSTVLGPPSQGLG